MHNSAALSPAKVPHAISLHITRIDFTSDALWCGRRFQTFNVLDDFNREALAVEVDLNLPAERVIRTLERIAVKNIRRCVFTERTAEITQMSIDIYALLIFTIITMSSAILRFKKRLA